MKLTQSMCAIIAMAGLASAAVAPQATPAPAKRQDIDSLLNQYSDLLTNSAFQSIAASLQQNPDFQSAVGDALTSNYAPLESLASSLATDTAASAAIVSAVGSSSAAALYSSASEAASSLSQSGSSSGSRSSTAASSTSSSSGNGALSAVNVPQAVSLMGLVGAAAAAFVLV